MIRVESLDGGVRLVVVDRPDKRNALSRDMVRTLRDRVAEADGERSVRGVVITGAGSSFSAGVDVGEFASGTADSAHALIEMLKDLCAQIRNLSKPVAVAVRGYCLGGALEVALAADFRVCAPDAHFGMPEVSVGLPSVIDAALLMQYIGLGRAKEMLLTGEPITAEQALAWGLVNRVVDAESVVPEAAALVVRVAAHHPSTVRAQKELIEDWLNEPLEESIENSIGFLVEAFREGVPQRAARELLERRRKV
ncbi:MAG TPA: enoyl-CoA hydratase-related protein [Candidatus Dormibacteraeota bacterium]